MLRPSTESSIPPKDCITSPVAVTMMSASSWLPDLSWMPGPHRIPRWLERAELFLRVMLRMYIGLAVCYAPWSKMFWDQNPIFVQFPTLSIYAANGAVRGIVSGLGLLNLWFAFRSVLQRRDQ